MSLATRCTHCGTIFKVVQDQLKVSEGWVRCGRCNEVFNALPSLFDLEKDLPPPRVSLPAATAAGSEAPASSTASPAADTSPAQATLQQRLADAATQALQQQGLLSQADVDLGLESQPPSPWEQTLPLPRQAVDEGALALDPEPIEATTDFELDTSIAVDDNTPLEDVIAATTPRHLRDLRPVRPSPPPQPARQPSDLDEDAEGAPVPSDAGPASVDAATTSPRATFAGGGPAPSPFAEAPAEYAPPWHGEPPQDLPTTEEQDALDSRYLMPTHRERPAHRLEEGPEFVDAQFPSDALLDAEEDWASDFGPSALDADAPEAARAAPPASPASRVTGEPAPSGHEASALTELHDGHPPATATGETGAHAHDEAGQPSYPLATLAGADADAHAAHPTPTFVRHAHRKAFWRRPATRAALSVIVALLLSTLGLQLAHQFRDLIAAYHPAARPLLAQWCEVAGCRLAPPLRLEELQIDSDPLFVRAASEGPDIYRLSVVVRNKAPVDLAWPHVDLTLTDANGAVLARRVLDPRDALWRDTAEPKTDAASPAEAASVPTAAPRERSTTLQWRLVVRDIQPVNYTAELFYP